MSRTISGSLYESNKADYEVIIHKLQKENLELSNAQLKDYRVTKWIARISFGISIILLIVHLYQFFNSF